ncbi:hypothetical protein ILYODFUR_027093 [Ilyodon furcidens]|uniref:Uncharacterized protein n=1 Tax=Ilyodon furcidens TaxID=33524 RepID=A0ABV0TED9_9TELE
MSTMAFNPVHLWTCKFMTVVTFAALHGCSDLRLDDYSLLECNAKLNVIPNNYYLDINKDTGEADHLYIGGRGKHSMTEATFLKISVQLSRQGSAQSTQNKSIHTHHTKGKLPISGELLELFYFFLF